MLAQRAYAIRNPLDWLGYGPNIWGITASDGPGDLQLRYRGETAPVPVVFGARRRAASESFDDGTIAPTAAIASLPFAPEVVVPAAREMHKKYGQYIYGKYGFVDAFNPSFDYDVPLRHGRRIRGVGWVATDYLGIDQGADHLDDREPSQRAHLERDETQPIHPARPQARGIRRRLAQPALSSSSGARPATDSSVSTKLVCQARSNCARSTSSMAWWRSRRSASGMLNACWIACAMPRES